MDRQCDSTLNMQSVYHLYSMRLKLTSRYAYNPNMNCMFTVNTTVDQKLMFHFKSMAIESSSSCRHDWLAIHDGGSINSPTVSGKNRWESMVVPVTVHQMFIPVMPLYTSTSL